MKLAWNTNSSQAIELSQFKAEMEEIKGKEVAEARKLKAEKDLAEMVIILIMLNLSQPM